MTPFEHYLFGSFICILLWNLWLKDYFYDEEEYQKGMKFWSKFFE